MCGKARSVAVVHTACCDGVSEEKPAVGNAVRNVVNVHIQLYLAVILAVGLADVHAYPVVSLHIHNVLTGAESVVFHSLHYLPAAFGVSAALSGVYLDGVV